MALTTPAPSGQTERRRGVRRAYSYGDVVLLRALNRICAGKGKIKHLKDGLVNFRRDFGPLKPGQRVDAQLFVQGDELCSYSGAEGGRQLRSGQMVFSFVVDLTLVSAEVADCVVLDDLSAGFSLVPALAREAEDERQRIWASVKTQRAAAM